MPPKSRNQQISAIIAEKAKSGTGKVKPGTPSAKMASMSAKQLGEFAKPTKGLPKKVKQPKGY
jgi:hypothetical protein